jgi:hypothetical protein
MNHSRDFSQEILDYLRLHRGKLVGTFTIVKDLTRGISDRVECQKTRGILLTSLSKLITAKKVIRYRKRSLTKRKPRQSQGLLRISEHHS